MSKKEKKMIMPNTSNNFIIISIQYYAGLLTKIYFSVVAKVIFNMREKGDRTLFLQIAT